MASFGFLTILLVLGTSLSLTTRQESGKAAQQECLGYEATDVTQNASSLHATLTLVGDCYLYSKDIGNLRLLVEYQAGKDPGSFRFTCPC